MAILVEWPAWALYTFVGLAALTAAVAVLQWVRDKDADEHSAESKPRGKQEPEFRAFQRQYLTVYTLIMMADWFQGTNMYTLYSSYGVNISALFLSGFLSGACWAGPVGFWIDKYGRRKSCIVYLVLEIIINVCEHFNHFGVLDLQVLGWHHDVHLVHGLRGMDDVRAPEAWLPGALGG